MRAGSVALVISEARSACKRASLCDRARHDLRLSWPVIPFRGLAARPGSLRQFQADSRAGSARDEKKPAVVMSNTSIDLQVFYGSDGTRTRDLRRDRPSRARRRRTKNSSEQSYLQALFLLPLHPLCVVEPIVASTFGPRVGHGILS